MTSILTLYMILSIHFKDWYKVKTFVCVGYSLINIFGITVNYLKHGQICWIKRPKFNSLSSLTSLFLRKLRSNLKVKLWKCLRLLAIKFKKFYQIISILSFCFGGVRYCWVVVTDKDPITDEDPITEKKKYPQNSTHLIYHGI